MGILDAPSLTKKAADTAYVSQGYDTRVRRYQIALAKRATSRVSILCFGDSFFEGTSATSYTRRWQAYMQKALRDRYQPAGVAGAALPYISAWPLAGGTITDFPVAYSGTVAYKEWSGLGLRVAEIGSTGGSVTFTFTGTSAKLYYPRGAFGKMSIVVDGGAATVVDQYSATLSGGSIFSIPSLSAGTHTVVVSRDASSVSGRTVPLEGLEVFNGDENAGIRVLDGGHHGLATSMLVDAFNVQFWPGSVAASGPHAAVLLGLGLNDATAPQTVATYKANMQSIVTKLRTTAGHTGFIGLVYWPLRSGTDNALWTSYGDALDQIAATDPDIKVIRARGPLPDEGTSYTDPAGLGLYDSTNHLIDAGQAFVADIFVKAVS